MKDLHIVLDLESMGTQSDAAIISIGASVMDHPKQVFHNAVDLVDSVKHGGTMNPQTILWWMEQSQEARNSFRYGSPLVTVLQLFTTWVKAVSELAGCEKPSIWGNGVDFDNVVLKSAYDRAGIDVPWGFRQNRCYRTLKNLYPEIPFIKPAVQHDALQDAIAQAEHLSCLLGAMK